MVPSVTWSPGLSRLEATRRPFTLIPLVEQWAAINSGTRNLAGCAAMANALSEAFGVLPGTLRLLEPTPAQAVNPDGRVDALASGAALIGGVDWLVTVGPLASCSTGGAIGLAAGVGEPVLGALGAAVLLASLVVLRDDRRLQQA